MGKRAIKSIILTAILGSLLIFKIQAGEIVPFVYNENFIKFYNESLAESSKDMPVSQNYRITPANQNLMAELNVDYELLKTVRVNDRAYGLLFRFDDKGVLEFIQLSLHESKVSEYHHFLRLLAAMLKMDYDEFTLNFGFTDKVLILPTNLRTRRLASSSYKKIINGYIYSHTYRQNQIFDLTFERKTSNYAGPYVP